MSVASPTVPPDFTYVYVSCEREEPLKEFKLRTGAHDEDLRNEIAQHFRSKALLNATQEKEAMQHVLQSAQSEVEKAAVQQLIANRESTFEIIPLIMPMKSNGFLSTSMYIDDVGRFKDLPLNDRASKIAQKDIRGDAFILRNYDDPCCDTWSRVSTTIPFVEELLQHPPSAPPSSQTMPTVASPHTAPPMDAMTDARAITEEDVQTATSKKAAGNALFSQGDYAGARNCYDEAYNALLGRDDFLPSHITTNDSIKQLRLTLLLNRGQCCLRQKDYSGSAKAAASALELNPTHPKAFFVLASSYLGLGEFEMCRDVVQAFCKKVLPELERQGMDPTLRDDASKTFEALSMELQAKEQAHRQAEKKMFSAMFTSSK